MKAENFAVIVAYFDLPHERNQGFRPFLIIRIFVRKLLPHELAFAAVNLLLHCDERHQVRAYFSLSQRISFALLTKGNNLLLTVISIRSPGGCIVINLISPLIPPLPLSTGK